MFKSAVRDIVVPQSEHGRLAGVIAEAWGNETFKLPAIPIERFAHAVSVHDECYGKLDTLEIGKTPVPQWLECRRRWLERRTGDVGEDILILRHTKSILADNPDPRCRPFERECGELLALLVRRQKLPEECFERMLSAFQLCDSISYFFCFERPALITRNVFFSPFSFESCDVRCKLLGQGRLLMHPWPLNVRSVNASVHGYESTGYPNNLKLVEIPFRLEPATSPAEVKE